MSAPAAITVEAAGAKRGLEYLELGKPRVVVMVVATTFVGFHLGSGGLGDWVLLLHTLASTALAAGGTLALNEYIERDLDRLMLRTRMRPVPSGRISAENAFVFGVAVTAIGILWQTFAVGPLAAAVTAATTASYLFLYTPLKRRTPLCTLVGAVPGALPPVTGWVAARGSIDLEPAILFAILFLWQLPHSLAIARLYRDDYARAGIRLLPVVDPDGGSTGRQVTLNSAALLAVALLPALIGTAGKAYFAAALLLGTGMLFFSIRLAQTRELADARRLLWASLVYLPVLLGILAFDRTA